MKVCVFGLWHLGSVTAACLASRGHSVVGLDLDVERIAKLQRGEPPLFEPGLVDLMREPLKEGTLRFSALPEEALVGAEVVWVTFDTPVDEDDRADVEFVCSAIRGIFPAIEDGACVVVSSQLPVGSTDRLADEYRRVYPERRVSFCYSPENLRLGKAIEVFCSPDRVVVGTDGEQGRSAVTAMLQPITDRIEWMSVASAEMVKHALNAFLATSVTFINEVATICERVGADAKEVERGLKSEVRIGPRAYLSPGTAFAGGTLARDIMFLSGIAAGHGFPAHLLNSVRTSNLFHKEWIRHRIEETLRDVKGKVVAVWGLTYKPGTDTLRRSSAVELCQWLKSAGAEVRAFDPAVKELPNELSSVISLTSDATVAARGADALVIATEWPEFKEAHVEAILSSLKAPVVIDPNRFLNASFGARNDVRYLSVGRR